MTDDAKDELKALVVRAREEKQRRFPETLRQRLMRYAAGRWKAGVSVRTVAAEKYPRGDYAAASPSMAVLNSSR